MSEKLKDLEKLKKAIEFNKKILNEIKESNNNSFINKHDLERYIKQQEDAATLYEYYLKRLEEIGENAEGFKLGNTMTIYLFLWDSSITCNFSLESKLVNELYDKVFGSYSGIGEWIESVYPKILEPLVGSSQYCYALGTFSILDVIKYFKNLNEYYSNGYIDDEQRKNHIESGYAIMDWLKNLSTSNNPIITKFDNLFRNYLDLVLEANSEEE